METDKAASRRWFALQKRNIPTIYPRTRTSGPEGRRSAVFTTNAMLAGFASRLLPAALSCRSYVTLQMCENMKMHEKILDCMARSLYTRAYSLLRAAIEGVFAHANRNIMVAMRSINHQRRLMRKRNATPQPFSDRPAPPALPARSRCLVRPNC